MRPFLTASTMMAALACAYLATPAAAIMIDFEMASGYAAGHLTGQPSSGTQWALTNGSSNLVNVAPGIGNSGAGLVNTSTGSGSNFVYYGFNPLNADLGGTFDASSSVLDYSFDWRPTQTLNGSNGQILFEFMVGSSANTGTNAALSLRIHSSGRFQAYDGATLRTIDSLFILNTWATISGQIDYANNTYTVFLNNTQLFTTFNGGNLAFQNAASDNAFIRFSNLRGGSDSAQWRQWNLDNIYLAIPEPGSLAILGVGAMLLARRRRPCL